MSRRTGPVQKGPPLYERIAPRVAELAAEGVARNDIARRLEVGATTVTRAARHAGATFNVAPVEAATAANVARHAATRAEQSDQAATIADQAGRRLLMELKAEVLDPGAVRSLATVYGIATDKHLALADTLTDPEQGQAAEALGGLIGAILARATPTN